MKAGTLEVLGGMTLDDLRNGETAAADEYRRFLLDKRIRARIVIPVPRPRRKRRRQK